MIIESLSRLQTKWPQANYETGDGSGDLIIIPSVQLPKGYNKTICTVLFIAPPGYPSNPPGDFFTDEEIAFKDWHKIPWETSSGEDGTFYTKTPQRTNMYNPVERGGKWTQWNGAMWWRWMVQAWNPNRDDIFTYMMTVQQRLKLVI